jgi:lysophospholipase L1-like esterase
VFHRRVFTTLIALLTLAACSSTTTAHDASPTPTITLAPSLTPPSATPTRPPVRSCQVGRSLGRGAVVSVIGDSYTTGGGAERWPTRLASRTGWTIHVDGADGSGYMIGGYTGHDFSGPRFPDQVRKLAPQRPDLVIIMGSRNDIGHTDPPYPTVVRDTLAAIRRAVPRTPLLVVGSYWVDAHPPMSLQYIHDVLRAATAKIPCASFLDPVKEGWFAGDTSKLIGPDGQHPTVAGLRHVADRYERDLIRLGYLTSRRQ